MRRFKIPIEIRRWIRRKWRRLFREITGIPWTAYRDLRKRHLIFKRDGYKCVYCGTDEKLTIDHYIPKKRGGTNHHSNLVTACHRCNQTKGGAHPDEVARKDKPNLTITIGDLMKYKEKRRKEKEND